ncbi:hypothetical protein CspeluHIS016_0404470 [Cutaneotrichosporon spelunceum]|uniref:FHA domain-containing protein n=1 Tax=Cutaneotrichosporon spelunceum TaxID=1672016 RepID=A0AAD3TVE0_9TREE|nr:hypothetical protein CspeluHIS016_0404470 [Cutaneotrichosporon spelunceum]
MPADTGPVCRTPDLCDNAIFLHLVEETQDYTVTVFLSDLLSKLCAPVTVTGPADTSHPDFLKHGGYSNLTGGYCIGRHHNKEGRTNLPSALSSRVLSRIHVKIVVDRTGVLWLMDLRSLHGTTVGRGTSNIPIAAYSPFCLQEGDVLILGKPVISRDGVTHLPLRLRVHYAFAPPVKPLFDFITIPTFANNVGDIALPPRPPTRGWGIPVTYESELEEDAQEDDIRPDGTVHESGNDIGVCTGSSKIVNLVIPPAHDDDADSVVFTGSKLILSPVLADDVGSVVFAGSKPNSPEAHAPISTPVPAPVQDVPIAANLIPCHYLYSPQDTAALRQSILAIPPADDEMGDTHSESSYGDGRVSEHSYCDDGVSEHSYDDDMVCEHSQGEDDCLSDGEHYHNSHLGSDRDDISDEEHISYAEAEDYDCNMSGNYDLSDDEVSDRDDEASEGFDLSDGANGNISMCSVESEHEGIDVRDSDCHSQATRDEAERKNEEPMALSQALHLPLVNREPTPFYPSSANATIVPSSMPEEDDFAQPVDQVAINEMFASAKLRVKAAVERIGAIDKALRKDVLKSMGGDGEVLVSSSQHAAPSNGNEEPRNEESSLNATGSSHSLTLSPTTSARSGSPVAFGPNHRSKDVFSDEAVSPMGSFSPRASPISQHEEGPADIWSEAQRPELPSVAMVPDEIEEPRFDVTEENDAEIGTATSNQLDVTYSIPPSPPASISNSASERIESKIYTVNATLPLTPPSPVCKALTPEASTRDASSCTQPMVTMDAATNTSTTTRRKRKLSVVEKKEASSAHATPGAIMAPTNVSSRPTRRRRIGTFVTGVALGVGIGVVSTFGALYQLGAE